MIRTTLSAAAASLLLAASPVSAQSEQEKLDARYDRALAAGYKALFLCSAIANAERNGVTRSVESVEAWELTGIQAPLDTIVPELKAEVYRAEKGGGVLSHVAVDWADDMPPRLAWHKETDGCSLGPIGMRAPPKRDKLPRTYPEGWVMEHDRIITGAMARVFDAAFASGYGEGSRTTAIIVSGKEGQGIWRYHKDFGPATPQRTWSVAKSIAATLVGVAVHRGDADVSVAADLEVSLSDPRTDITIDHMLRMASGRYTDTPGNRTDPLYFGGSSVAETAAHWPILHGPGTVYRYANNDTLMAVESIDHMFASYSPADFFAQARMNNTVAETDWRGDYVLSSQVWATAPDLQRLGQLYLNDGVLPDGTRILPEGWVDYVSSPSGPQPEGRNIGYGAGFWLFNQNEGIPPDTFAAMGNRGQYVVIVPSRDVVIVRRGEDPAGSRFDILAFTKDVLAALED